MSKESRYSQWRSLSGHVKRIFVHKNWRGEGYWQHLVSTGRCYVPYSRSYTRCFAPRFWRSHYQPQSWCHLAISELQFKPLDYYLWGAIKDKCYADKPETIDALKDNISEAIGEIQLHTIANVLKNLDRSSRLVHGQSRQSLEWNYLSLLTVRIVLWNKKRKFRKIFSSFFKAFSKKKNSYLVDLVI